MSYIYAGTDYRTEHEAQIDQIHAWITPTGSTVEALTTYWDDAEHITSELERDHREGNWTIPGLGAGCDRSDIEDVLEEWEAWARGHAIREIRDELDLDQADFAKMLRLGAQTRVSEYENHRVTPSKQTVMLAAMLAGAEQDTFGEMLIHSTINQLESYWSSDREEWGLLGPVEVADDEVVRFAETRYASGEYQLERRSEDGIWYVALPERFSLEDVPRNI
jgi:transcriptional regulator with XRE-family HTH domain